MFFSLKSCAFCPKPGWSTAKLPHLGLQAARSASALCQPAGLAKWSASEPVVSIHHGIAKKKTVPKKSIFLDLKFDLKCPNCIQIGCKIRRHETIKPARQLVDAHSIHQLPKPVTEVAGNSSVCTFCRACWVDKSWQHGSRQQAACSKKKPFAMEAKAHVIRW